MKKLSVISALTAVLIATTSTLTFADPPDHAPAWGHRDHERGDKHNKWHDRDDHDYRDVRDHRDDRYRDSRYDNRTLVINPRYANVRHYQRGDRIERIYLNDRYYVNDWRARRLQAPPSGYRWVNRDGQYLLVALATGIIANIILSH